MTRPDVELDEILATARHLVRMIERAMANEPDRPPVVSPPCPRHADQPASRCGRCAAEAVAPPTDIRRRARETA